MIVAVEDENNNNIEGCDGSTVDNMETEQTCLAIGGRWVVSLDTINMTVNNTVDTLSWNFTVMMKQNVNVMMQMITISKDAIVMLKTNHLANLLEVFGSLKNILASQFIILNNKSTNNLSIIVNI